MFVISTPTHESYIELQYFAKRGTHGGGAGTVGPQTVKFEE